MPSEYSYGPDSQAKVQQLLEVLLDGVGGTDGKLDARWDEQAKALLVVETTLEVLRVLLHGKQQVLEKVKTNQCKQIGECLTHYLGKFLGIWQDRRLKKRGSSRWIFSLQLWSRDKDENLRQFRELWRKRQPENSPTCDTPIFETPHQSTKTVVLERLPEVPVWVGRDELIEDLTAKILAPETSPKVVALIGQGGIGKTSLAVKLLEALGVNLQPPGLADGCIYDSALYFKVSQGSSFNDVAVFLLEALGVEVAETLKTLEAKILAALTQKRCLLVLDNLEDILYPASHPEAGKAISPEWGELLHSFAHSRHCSTLIITSRELPVDLADRRTRNAKPNPKLVEVCPVDGVADADGVEILRQNGLQDCEADLEWIAERVKGNVFILTHLGINGAKSPGYLRKHPELVTEEAEPIIRTQLERQSEAARELLKRMCVLRVGIDVQGLTFLRLYEPENKDERFEKAVQLGKPVEFTKDEIKETEEIINRLGNSSLVQRRYDKERWKKHFYDLHRLILEFIQAEYKTELPKLWARAYTFYCTGNNIENPKTLEDLHPMIEAQHFAFKLEKYNVASNLLTGELERCLESWGYWSLLKGLYEESLLYVHKDEYPYFLERIGLRNRDIGEWKKAEKYYQIALTITEKHNNEFLTASLKEHLGDLEKLRGNLDRASHLYNQALKIRIKLSDRSGIASCWGQLGEIERFRGNWEEAKYYYSTSLELQVPSDRSARATILGVLGDIELKQGNWKQAKSFYNEALQLRTELGERSGIAISWGVFGDIERLQGNWDEAERWYRQALQALTELRDRSGIAVLIGCLGENEFARGNLDAAEDYLTQALSTMQELGMSWDIAEINYDFAQLWRKRGNAEKAQEYYTTAHRLYQQMGAVKGLERIEREWNLPD